MADAILISHLRRFFPLVEYAFARHLIDFLAIATGRQLGKPSNAQRVAAGKARDSLVKDGEILKQSVKCRLPHPHWNGLIWRSRWDKHLSADALATRLASPLEANWDQHTAKSNSSPLCFLPQHEADLVESVCKQRSEYVTSRLHLTSVLLRKLAAMEITEADWSLQKPLRFTDVEHEVASPVASFNKDSKETLVCIPVPPFWVTNNEQVTREYIERMVKHFRSDSRPYELWLPRHPKAAWLDLKPFMEKDD